MIGAIIGDIVGSRFEFKNYLDTDFELFSTENDFTDDTVCTIATADWIVRMHDDKFNIQHSYTDILQSWCRKYRKFRGYGAKFTGWIDYDPRPYNSYGNGSGMRVSPVGYYFPTAHGVLKYATLSAQVSHNHKEGIHGARAIALAIYLARQKLDKTTIGEHIQRLFGYRVFLDINKVRETNSFNETCQITVPQAIAVFLASNDFEDAIRLAVSIGGDSDTIACMAGGIAGAYYGVPDNLIKRAYEYLPEDMVAVVEEFNKRVICY